MISRTSSERSYVYAIEPGGSLQAPNGLLVLSGWIAGWSDTHSLVRLRLAPSHILECRSGQRRPDVVEAYPRLPGAAQSGFILEAYIPAGIHLGTFEYCRSGSSDWIPFHTTSITVGLSPLLARLESSMPADVSDEEWYVHGWCFHPQYEIESLTLQFAQNQTDLEFGATRRDVADNFPLAAGAAIKSGFVGQLRLGAAQAEVQLTARLRNGSLLRKVLLPKLKIRDRKLQWATHEACIPLASNLKFDQPEQPEVSIIIPIYNQLEVTMACLESLVRHAGTTLFEVIVIDDNSDAHVRETLSLIRGLRLFSNESNQGFVLNCNRGAAEARGRYVLFLNNDTEVTAGWLEAMLGTFTRFTDAGLVGAKLVYPDGRLQEAGGILWADGSAWNYGNGDDPTKPEYNYVRRTDYCSGACIMLRRQLFAQLGGFDERFIPAYCEDSDLAFQVRAAGYQVYYQPHAVVIHHEGKSNGTSTADGIKKYQTTNSAKLFEKWRDVLASEHRPNAVDVFRARERSLDRKVILFIDHYLPHYDRDAGSRTIWSYLNFFLEAGFSVKFIGHNYHPHQPYLTEMQQRGIEVLWGSWYGLHWERWLERVGRSIDYVFFSRAHVAPYYLPSFRRNSTAKLLFYGHDLLSRTYEREYQLTGDPNAAVELEKWTEMEDAVFGSVDVAYYPSCEEIRHLSKHRPALKARQLPPFVFKKPALNNYGTTLNQRAGLLFVGGFIHPPNVDAMLWFTREVWPAIQQKYPQVHLTIAGSNPPPEIATLESSTISVTGYVPDTRLEELYATHRLVVVPLRQGGGIKGKVVEALWHGLPILTTPVGAEGIPESDTCMCVVPPEQFADALMTLLENQKELDKMAHAGIRVLAEHYSTAALHRVLCQDIDLR
jgi:GT2 family glycosyltransferase